MSTHVLMVIDMSGSMYDLAEDVRGGFNQYIQTLQEDSEIDYQVSVTLFNTILEPLAVAKSIREIPKLDNYNYLPQGMTALLDAVGQTITDFESRNQLDDGERVLMVINTDGMENSSKEFSTEKIRKLIEDRKNTGNWDFLFMGAGPDAWAQGESMGVDARNVVRYANTSDNVHSTYAVLGRETGQWSRGRASGQSIAEEIKTNVDE